MIEGYVGRKKLGLAVSLRLAPIGVADLDHLDQPGPMAGPPRKLGVN